jgi:hypothetical protein
MVELFGVYRMETNNGSRIGVCHKLSPIDHFECLADNLERDEALKICRELSNRLDIDEYDSRVDKTNNWSCLRVQMEALGSDEEEIKRILELVQEWN